MPDAQKTKRSSRIITFDLMRGYFLLAIIINHLHYFPNGFGLLTLRGEMFVSSAEGFFLISGIVLGIVRGRKLLERPLKVAAGLLLKRSFQIYAAYAVITILFTLLGWWFFMGNPGLKFGIMPPDTGWWEMLWRTLSFDYFYGWVDYLRLYAIFLFVSPIVVWMLRRRLWLLVLTLSAITWYINPDVLWPASQVFQPLSWQLIFFSGMVIGFHWQEITSWWQRLSLTWRKSLVGTTLAIAALSLAANALLAFGGMISSEVFQIVSPIREALAFEYFDKENLPLARLALFTVWFWASFWLYTKLSRFAPKKLRDFLYTFGTHSLYVYIVSGMLIFLVHALLPPASTIYNFLVTASIITIVWLMIRYKVLFQIIPR